LCGCVAAQVSTFARSSGASWTPVTGTRPVAGLRLFFCNGDVDFRIVKTTALTPPAEPLTPRPPSGFQLPDSTMPVSGSRAIVTAIRPHLVTREPLYGLPPAGFIFEGMPRRSARSVAACTVTPPSRHSRARPRSS
jgi:hypothetical protein